jgi:hypothetical protein
MTYCAISSINPSVTIEKVNAAVPTNKPDTFVTKTAPARETYVFAQRELASLWRARGKFVHTYYLFHQKLDINLHVRR